MVKMISRLGVLFCIALAMLLLVSPLGMALLCKPITISADQGYDMNYTFVKVNLTGLTFSDPAELRIKDSDCYGGGSQVKYNFTTNDTVLSSDWVSVYFTIEEELDAGASLTYSVEYDNGLSADPNTDILWKQLSDDLFNGRDVSATPKIWSGATAGRFIVRENKLHSEGGNNAPAWDDISAFIPTTNFCTYYRMNLTDGVYRDLAGFSDGSTPQSARPTIDFERTGGGVVNIRYRNGGVHSAWFTQTDIRTDGYEISLRLCANASTVEYSLWNQSGQLLGRQNGAYSNTSSIIGFGWQEADQGTYMDEFYLGTNPRSILYPDYPSVSLGAEQSPVITNSSWNVTGGNVVGSTTAWVEGGTINLTSNLLSFTVSSSQATNMSCRLDVEGNYSENIAYDSRTKATTTETTSHSITLFENISVGSHNVYCSFINSAEDLETASGVSHSGALKIVRTQFNTSVKHFDFEASEIVFDSSSYLTVVNQSFDLVGANTIFMKSSLVASKFSVPASTDLYGRVTFNDVEAYSGRLRSISGLGDIGSINIPILRLDGVAGENRVAVQFRETGAGAVNLTELQFHFWVNESAHGDGLRFDLFNTSFGVSDSSYAQYFNFSLSNSFERSVVLDASFTLFNNTVDDSKLSCRFNSSQFGQSSFFRRTMQSSADVGSTGLIWLADPVFPSVTLFGVSCFTNGSNEVFVNGTISSSSLIDGGGRVVRSFSASNSSTGVGSYIDLSAGTHRLVHVENFTVGNGSSLEMGAVFSGESLSGDQVANVRITGSGSSCESDHRRSFSEGDTGVLKFFHTCNSFSRGDNVSLSLDVVVETGETLRVYDEVLTGVEMSDLLVNVSNLPPVVVVTEPVNNSQVAGVTTISWLASDGQSDPFLVNVTIFNNTIEYEVFNDSILSTFDFNFSTLPLGLLNVTVFAWENESDELLIGSDTVTVENKPIAFLNVTVVLLNPANDSVLSQLNTTFGFSLDNVTNCTLVVNDVDEENFLNVNGTVQSSLVGLSNATWYNWTVNCTGATTPDLFYFNVSADVFSSVLDSNICPVGLDGWIPFIVMFMLCFVMIVFGLLFRMPIISGGSSLLLGMVLLFLFVCLSWFFLLMSMLCFVMGVMFFFRGFRGEEF